MLFDGEAVHLGEGGIDPQVAIVVVEEPEADRRIIEQTVEQGCARPRARRPAASALRRLSCNR